jgi:WD40 repeat protein
VATLQILPSGPDPGEQFGEILCCTYTPDGAFVLSGGWDGYLRLWEAAFGAHVTSLRASEKPVAACAVSPDGKHWLSGSLEGMLTHWDALTHQQESTFLAHPRPISAIVHAIDGKSIATASWDGNLALWTFRGRRDRDSRMLTGHRDIVAGCQMTPDGQSLLSWSYDSTVRLWNLARAQQVQEWTSHTDRVTTGSVSPDGQYAASGARNGVLKLWDLHAGREVATLTLGAELRGCPFLLAGDSLVVVDMNGRLTVLSVPTLEKQAELFTRLPVQAMALAPSGGQLALACSDGRVHFVGVEGIEDAPLVVTARQSTRRTANALQRLFGQSRIQNVYHCVCPACRQMFELPNGSTGQSAPCPNCRRRLRISAIARE